MVKKYYTRLAESLERKYAPGSSNINEAWSDTMPDWMKPRLNQLARNYEGKMENSWDETPKKKGIDKKYFTYPKFKQAYNDAVQQGYNHREARQLAYNAMGFSRDKADYITPRGQTWQTQQELQQNLFKQFHDNLGIDLQTAQFVETEPPKSQRHPAFSSGNIPIWYIVSTGQVYAKGVNDYEAVDDPNSPYYGKAFKYVPLKTLNEMSEGNFCYIDGSSINRSSVPKKLANRKDFADWEGENPLLTRGEPGETSSVYTSSNIFKAERDKSGYYVIPTLDKYRDVVERNSALKKYMSVPEEAERTLRKYYSMLQRAASTGTWRNPVSTEYFHDAYVSLLTEYKKLLACIDYMLNTYGENSEGFMRYLTSSPDRSYMRAPSYSTDYWWPNFKASCDRINDSTEYLKVAASSFDTTTLDI